MTLTTNTELGDTAFHARLDENAAAVEVMLDSLLSPETRAGETARPVRLLDAMRYAVLGGGKRLRPFLLIETARICGAFGSGVLRAAAAVEMVHCYSLAHDDLPAMDNDDLRRGKPTLHKAFGEAAAILAGDSLLTYAFDILGDLATHADASVRADLVTGLARASGIGGMAGGQALDLEAERSPAALNEDAIRLLQSMKTGALLRFAVEAGAIIAGSDAPRRAALVKYGAALGAAFQVTDDILDAEGDENAIGKRTRKDAARNKATLVGAMGLEAARRRRDDLARAAQDALEEGSFPSSPEVLGRAALYVATRHR